VNVFRRAEDVPLVVGERDSRWAKVVGCSRELRTKRGGEGAGGGIVGSRMLALVEHRGELES